MSRKNVDKNDLISRVEERLSAKDAGEHVPADNYLGLGPQTPGAVISNLP